MKITRLGPDVLSFEDGREIQYEAETEPQSDVATGGYIENGQVVHVEEAYIMDVVIDVTTDPVVTREEREAILEFLNGELGI